MLVWIDLTNAPHVPVLAPLVRVLEERGATVELTARPYGQTAELAALHGLHVEEIGAHGGRSRLGKGRAAVGRVHALRRWAKGRGFDVGLAHGSTDQPMVGRLLGFPTVTMFDYEGARLQHGVNCRLAARVLVPDAIPVSAITAHGARAAHVVRFPGLKEEYALWGFEADPAVRVDLGVRPDALLAIMRPPPELAQGVQAAGVLTDGSRAGLALRPEVFAAAAEDALDEALAADRHAIAEPADLATQQLRAAQFSARLQHRFHPLFREALFTLRQPRRRRERRL